MTEHVLRIVKRERGHPLAEEMILEFGIDVDNQRAFIEAVGQLAELLRIYKTPEALADFMRDNAALANARQLTFAKE